jgi:serine/threonine protein phosphatase PrpC
MNSDDFEIGQASLQGNRRSNQDRCIAIESGEIILLGLADGMGGHPRGDRAAEILTETCDRFFYQAEKPIRKPSEFLTRLLQKSHENITAFGLEQYPAIDPRTTAVVALIQKGTVYWAHAGDSRFYLFRDGAPLYKTEDHSYVARLEQHGVISAEEREHHPQQNYVTRCLGGEISVPEITLGNPIQLQNGDAILLCSDGLWSHVGEDTMGSALQKPMELSEIMLELARQAEEDAYPESDNVTAIGLRWSGEEAQSSEKQSQETQENTTVDPEDALNNAIEKLKHAIEDFESKELP